MNFGSCPCPRPTVSAFFPLALCAELLLPARLHRSTSTAAPRLHPLIQLRCCSPIASASAQCCSPIAPASTAVPRLRPLRLLLPDCVCFDCCSPTHPPAVLQPVPNILRGVRGSVNWKVGRHYSLVPPYEHPTSVTHTHLNVNILFSSYHRHRSL